MIRGKERICLTLERGEKAMRFSQTATRYHFLANLNGGVIRVQTKDPADATNRNDIAVRLGDIAKALGSGDFARALGSGCFDIPVLVHDTDRPEVQEMKRLQENIQYSFEETPTGGRVVISSANKEAVEAIHRFLFLWRNP
jgi:hypothetical protein